LGEKRKIGQGKAAINITKNIIVSNYFTMDNAAGRAWENDLRKKGMLLHDSNILYFDG
jgi:hypothetical protein